MVCGLVAWLNSGLQVVGAVDCVAVRANKAEFWQIVGEVG